MFEVVRNVLCMISIASYNKGKLFLAIFAIACLSCGRQNTSFYARQYHNMNSVFNGNYNAEDLFRKTIRSLEDAYEYPDQGFIDIIPYGDEKFIKQFDKNFETIIKKNDLLMFRHPNGEWIDDSRFLSGKAWYYRQEYPLAMQNFDEVLNNFPDFDESREIQLWKAKTYYKMENQEMARDVLSEFFLERPPLKLKKQTREEMSVFRIQMAMDEKDYAGATRMLEESMKDIKGLGRRARAHFLLAQLHEEAGDYPRSLTNYRAVKKYTNEYDFIFKSKLKVAQLYIRFQEGNDEDKKVLRYLKKMLRDDKNLDFKDQIYYEMANLELKKDSLTDAVTYLKKSIANSTKNPRQKGLSYYKTGHVYFYEYRNFPQASAYFDSASKTIPQTALEYKEIQRVSKNFKDYVTCVETIHFQDSMLYLADLPKEKLDAYIDSLHKAELQKQKALAEKQQKELEAAANLQDLNNLNQLGGGAESGGNRQNSAGKGWYFDDPSRVSSGKLDFERKWGKRPNEDNWRRKNKEATISDTPTGTTGSVAGTGSAGDSAVAGAEGDKLAYYQNIPKTEEERALAHSKIAESLYRLGQVYSQALNEPDSAIKTFEYLLDRYEKSTYSLQARYGLYQLYAKNENPLAEAQKNIILNEYPNSVFAYLIQGYNPEEIEREVADFDYAYQGLFRSYYTGQYITSLGFSEYLMDKYQDRPGVDWAKVRYIRGMSYGYVGLLDSLEVNLATLINDFPDHETTPLARETLRLKAQGFSVRTKPASNPGSPTDGTDSTANASESGEDDPRFKGFAKAVRNGDKIFVLMLVSKDGTNKSELKAQLDQFNSQSYAQANLKTFVFDYQKIYWLPYITSFDETDLAQSYIQALMQSPTGLGLLRGGANKLFYITQDNFREAYGKKRMEDYIAFYEAQLSK